MASICVVGAGFAGLNAAAILNEAGHAVRVLEARGRLGGRTRTALLGNKTVDVGGQWIGAGHQRLRALAGDAGASVRQQYVTGGKVLHLRGRAQRYEGLIPKVSPLALVELELVIRKLKRNHNKLNVEAPWDAAKANVWDSQTLASWAKRHLRSRSAREIFDIAVRSVMTCEANALSFLYFLFYCASNGGFDALTSTTEGAQAEVVVGGMPQLAEHLGASFAHNIRLKEPVRSIEQGADGVRITTNKNQYTADRVLISVPPALVNDIEFSPALPVRRARLAAQMPMGSVIKALVAYAKPFWREAGLSGEAVSHELPFSTVFDASWPAQEGGALVGFFDGQAALDYADADETVRRQAVIDSLACYFGESARDPLHYTDYNWLQDDWARGCYAGAMMPGAMSSLGSALREPCGRIHWAGTETAARWCGYIEGALASAERAAAELIDASAR